MKKNAEMPNQNFHAKCLKKNAKFEQFGMKNANMVTLTYSCIMALQEKSLDTNLPHRRALVLTCPLLNNTVLRKYLQ